MSTVFLILGGNLGDRRKLLEEAREHLQQLGSVIRSSAIYETEPWGFEHSNLFLNQVVVLETSLEPLALLHGIQSIERDMGRVRGKERYSARMIDIDILFYDDRVVTLPQLIIPHPEIPNRRFVLEPLCEIAPFFEHPSLLKTLAVLLEKCTDRCMVKEFTGN